MVTKAVTDFKAPASRKDVEDLQGTEGGEGEERGRGGGGRGREGEEHLARAFAFL